MSHFQWKGSDNEQETQKAQFRIKGQGGSSCYKNEATIFELAARFGVLPNMIAKWKRNLVEGAADIFDKG
jgi:hypothetical protein